MSEESQILTVLTNIQKEIREVRAEVTVVAQKLDTHVSTVEKAFPLNDLSLPDYDGHRRDHTVRMEESKTMSDYKHTVTKNILNSGTAFILLLLGLGFLSLAREKLGL